MVLPFKINSRVGYVNETMKLKLKKRRKIEHVFCRMDKFKKIYLRTYRFITQLSCNGGDDNGRDT